MRAPACRHFPFKGQGRIYPASSPPYFSRSLGTGIEALPNSTPGTSSANEYKKPVTAAVTGFLSGAGYGNRTRLLGLGSRCTTDVLTLRCVNSDSIADLFGNCKSEICGIMADSAQQPGRPQRFSAVSLSKTERNLQHIHNPSPMRLISQHE